MAQYYEDSKEEWMDKFHEYSIHRYPKAHERVWRIGSDLIRLYGGDARNIWNGQTIQILLDRLNEIKVGEQIARMIVGALCDTNQIIGVSDVKADIHVRRVLGRILKGDKLSSEEATAETRKLFPENPWILDQPLYWLGKNVCLSKPKCYECYLQRECTYFKAYQ